MKNLNLLLLGFCVLNFSSLQVAQADDDLFSDLEIFIESLDATETQMPAERVLADTSVYRSRWSQRQSRSRRLSGRTTANTQTSSNFSLRKNRKTRAEGEERSKRPLRTSSRRVNSAATSAKAQLLQKRTKDRSQYKPQRFSNRSEAKDTDTLTDVLEALELDFDLDALLK